MPASGRCAQLGLSAFNHCFTLAPMRIYRRRRRPARTAVITVSQPFSRPSVAFDCLFCALVLNRHCTRALDNNQQTDECAPPQVTRSSALFNQLAANKSISKRLVIRTTRQDKIANFQQQQQLKRKQQDAVNRKRTELKQLEQRKTSSQ